MGYKMSNHSEVIKNYLESKDKYFCDDCLSKLLDIKPRQTINAMCNKLFKQDMINRCEGNVRIVKRLKG